MDQAPFVRKTIDPETVQLSSAHCTFTVTRLRPGVLHVAVSGYDRGEFGLAVLDEVQREIRHFEPILLFVDAREAVGVVPRVSEAWTAWFRSNRERIRRVNVLVKSKYVHQTVAVAKLLSHTGDLIAIYSDEAKFEQAISRAVSPNGSYGT